MRVVGVDDWALRKGQTYGTILVDLEKQQPIELLPSREAAEVSAWSDRQVLRALAAQGHDAVGNLLVGRMARWQGLTPDDVVHSVYGHGMINGGHYIREAFAHFTNSIFLSAGTGIETRSATQVQLMADFGATVIVDEAGPSLRWAEATVERITREGGGSSSHTAPDPVYGDEEPF